jgi:hypothetical protein
MPWTNPETFTAGQTLTAASMNLINANVDTLREGRPSAVTPMVKCVRSGDLSLTAPATIAWNGTDKWDTDSMHDPVTNNSRITFTTAGIYLVVFNAHATMTGTASTHDYFITGGAAATVLAANFKAVSSYTAATNGSCTVTTMVSSAEFAYVEARISFPSTLSSTLKDDARSSFSATWVGPTP